MSLLYLLPFYQSLHQNETEQLLCCSWWAAFLNHSIHVIQEFGGEKGCIFTRIFFSCLQASWTLLDLAWSIWQATKQRGFAGGLGSIIFLVEVENSGGRIFFGFRPRKAQIPGFAETLCLGANTIICFIMLWLAWEIKCLFNMVRQVLFHSWGWDINSFAGSKTVSPPSRVHPRSPSRRQTQRRRWRWRFGRCHHRGPAHWTFRAPGWVRSRCRGRGKGDL